MPVTVLLVDDEPLVRAGLRAVLEAQPDIEVVGEAADGAAVIPLVRQLRPDVVAMDVRMPLLDGIEATRAVLRTVDGPPKILVITTFENDEYVYEALRAGADGFLLKRARPAEIVHDVRLVAEGESLLFPASVRQLAAEYGDDGGNRAARALMERAQLTRAGGRGAETDDARLVERGDRRPPRGRNRDGQVPCQRRPGEAGGTRPNPGSDSGVRVGVRGAGLTSAPKGCEAVSTCGSAAWARPAPTAPQTKDDPARHHQAAQPGGATRYDPANTRTSWEDGRWGG